MLLCEMGGYLQTRYVYLMMDDQMSYMRSVLFLWPKNLERTVQETLIFRGFNDFQFGFKCKGEKPYGEEGFKMPVLRERTGGSVWVFDNREPAVLLPEQELRT